MGQNLQLANLQSGHTPHQKKGRLSVRRNNMKPWAYRIGSLLAGSVAFVVLDIHVGFLRLMTGGLLVCISFGLWDAAGKHS